MSTKYIHTDAGHQLASPKEIVPEIMELINPQSVVDIGCAIGAFLYCFKEAGVKDVLGLDGNWVDRELMSKYLSDGEFMEIDLEKGFQLSKQYDLVVCLEVAEHVSAAAADALVKNIVSSGKTILFSAAIPLQGGQNHINEQWLTYWEEKFLTHDYVLHDVLRPIFWDNKNILDFYRQNMVIFAPADYQFQKEVPQNVLKNVVHYDFYQEKAQKLNAAIKGELHPIKYLGYFFISLVGRKNLKKLQALFKRSNA